MADIVMIGTSRGGLVPLKLIVSMLPVPCTAAIFIVQDVGSDAYFLPEILGKLTKLVVFHPMDGDGIKAGMVYVAPVGRHMVRNQVSYNSIAMPKFTTGDRPLIPCFSLLLKPMAIGSSASSFPATTRTAPRV